MNLEELFNFYIETEVYSQEHCKSCLPYKSAELFNTLQSMLTYEQYNKVEGLLIDLASEIEEFGFINGFKFLSRIN